MGRGDSRRQARSLIETDAVSLAEVWIRYWGQGGNADLLELDASFMGCRFWMILTQSSWAGRWKDCPCRESLRWRRCCGA